MQFVNHCGQIFRQCVCVAVYVSLADIAAAFNQQLSNFDMMGLSKHGLFKFLKKILAEFFISLRFLYKLEE